MTIKEEYFRYLDHFGPTVTLREMHRQSGAADMVALRHDVDHDLNLALEVAHHEHERGIRATYFLLHTHPYWNDPQFALKCRQLEAYGHEVGLHINALVQWIRGETHDVDATLREALNRLRDAGVTVDGVSAHGDKACYIHNLINYWMFSELHGDDPRTTERGKSAEGVVVDDPQWQVRYPDDHALNRSDGCSLQLWSSSLAKHGLAYDAMHVRFDRYWTDSGGTWSRTGDPISADLRRGRHQVLVHPFWWRGPRKTIFVMSTARAGSAWLANFVDRATSCQGLHEWTLNHHRQDEDIVTDKRTGDDFLSLVEKPQQTSILIRNALAAFKVGKRDVLEANVYLEPFIERIRAIAPECILVHLHRDGTDVVRSILNRGWFATPVDRRHRAVPGPRWKSLNQFERACWYYRFTNERLMPMEHRICFERMVGDLEYLTGVLKRLDIVVHPLLAAEEFSKRINANVHADVGPIERWPRASRKTFQAVCSGIQHSLGYAQSAPIAKSTASGPRKPKPFGTRVLRTIDVLAEAGGQFSAHQLSASWTPQGLVIQPADSKTSGWVLLTRGNWRAVDRRDGIPRRRGAFYTGEASAEFTGDIKARVFVLCMNSSGQLESRFPVATLRPPLAAPSVDEPPDETNGRSVNPARLAFALPAGARHFAMAISVEPPDRHAPGQMVLKSLMLSVVALESKYHALTPRPPRRARSRKSSSIRTLVFPVEQGP